MLLADPSGGTWTRMPRVIFCDQCGTIMDEPTHSGTHVECRLCGTSVESSGARHLTLAAGPCSSGSLLVLTDARLIVCTQYLSNSCCTQWAPSIRSRAIRLRRVAAGGRLSACARPCRKLAQSASIRSYNTTPCSCAPPTRARPSSTSAPGAATPSRRTHKNWSENHDDDYTRKEELSRVRSVRPYTRSPPVARVRASTLLLLGQCLNRLSSNI